VTSKQAKNTNAKNAQDNSRWFDDSHAQFTLEFMKNLANATELRQKSKKQDMFVQHVDYTRDLCGFLLATNLK
jgi:hypothetical protein